MSQLKDLEDFIRETILEHPEYLIDDEDDPIDDEDEDVDCYDCKHHGPDGCDAGHDLDFFITITDCEDFAGEEDDGHKDG